MIRSLLYTLTTLLLLGILPIQEIAAQNDDQPSLLVFTKTDGFRHQSIPAGVDAFEEISEAEGFTMTHTEDASHFNANNLAQYDAVVFLNTTQNVLNEQQQEAFESYITGGGGFVGVHSASDTEYDWPWYNQLVGAYFNGHPRVQEATVRVVDQGHSSTQHLPEAWVRTDEWYNFKNIQDHLNILAYLDESTYEGGTNGDNHPIAWYHEQLGGRAWYTGGGHTSESYSNDAFRQHLIGGINYVLGE